MSYDDTNIGNDSFDTSGNYTTRITPSPPPRASLETLPLELRVKIAHHCKLQDTAYKQRMSEALTATKDSLGAVPEVNWGHSLASLSSVNKAWRSIAAPFLFDTVLASHTSPSVFRFAILPTYHRYFRTLEFDDATPEQLLALLPHLASFPLKNIQLGVSTLDVLYGALDLTEPNDEVNFRLQSFWTATTKVETLRLDSSLISLSMSSLDELLSHFPALRDLSLSTSVDTPGMVEQLGVVLAGLESLQKLSVSFAETTQVEVPPSWNDLEWKSTATLQNLAIRTSILSQPTYQFAQRFPHLSGLSLSATKITTVDELDRSAIAIASTNLPQLASLQLSGPTEPILSIIKEHAFSTTRPSLAHLDLRLTTVPPNSRSFLATLGRFRNLRSIAISQSKYKEPRLDQSSLARYLIKHCSHRHIHLDRTTLWDPLATPRRQLSSDLYKLEVLVRRRCEAATEVIRVGQLLVDRAGRNGDLAEIQDVLDALRPLRSRVLREMD